MNLGIVLPNWIGDLVMATPALRAIRNFYGPRATITGVMRPYVAQALAGTTWLDERVYCDRKSKDPQQTIGAVAQRLRETKLDAVVLLPNSLSTGWLAWRSGARIRLGYARYGRGLLLNRKLDAPRAGGRLTPISAVDYYLELAYALGCPPEAKRVELQTLAGDDQIAEQIWERMGFSQLRQVVTLNTGSATGLARDWPIAHFTELAKQIVARHSDTAVLVLCGPAQRETAAEMERNIGHDRVRSMADEDLSLGVSKSCIRRADLMVTTDSGPRHIAAAFQVPTIALCGPIDPRWSNNYNPAETVLTHDVECRPCDKKTCPLGHQACMRDLGVDRVYAAVRKKLEDQRVSKVA